MTPVNVVGLRAMLRKHVASASKQNATKVVYVSLHQMLMRQKSTIIAVTAIANRKGVEHKNVAIANVAMCIKREWHTVSHVIVKMVSVSTTTTLTSLYVVKTVLVDSLMSFQV